MIVSGTLRQQRLRDLLQAVADWQRADGPCRLRARRNAMAAIADWKRIYAEPERAAFEAAVAKSKQRGRRAA